MGPLKYVLLLFAFSLTPTVAQLLVENQEQLTPLDLFDALNTCKLIEKAIDPAWSTVAYPRSEQYNQDIKHWMSSSTEDPACTVEPGSGAELSKIIVILSQQKTTFAVKGGGHTGNKGFSSTTGVHIAMSRLGDLHYYGVNNFYIDVGAGAVWDDVYSFLNGFERHVVGGRVKGVGVGGFTLGGGYSWLTNQYGLTIDTVLAFDVVLPNGTFTTVTNDIDPDLFWALRGGGNNFGIVTRFRYKIFPRQGELVWGGSIIWRGDELVPSLVAATVNFCNNNTDPKAALITNFIHVEGLALSTVNFFYDGPDPKGIFDEFLNIPTKPIDTDVKTRSFLDLVLSVPSDATADFGLRGVFNTGSVLKYSTAVVSQIANQSEVVAKKFPPPPFVNFAVEAFLPSIFNTSQGGSYPHSPSLPVFPLFSQIAWEFKENDAKFNTAIKDGINAIVNTALAEGQSVAGGNQLQYSNYALPDTPLPQVYGNNLARVQALKKKYDPDNVMGLAGGFKL